MTTYVLLGVWAIVVLILIGFELRLRYLDRKAYKQIDRLLKGQKLDEKEIYTLRQFRDYLEKKESEKA